MPVIHRYSIYAGLLSGALFYLTSSGLLAGVFVPFTPLVPMFWAGFRLGGHAIGHVALIALAFCLVLLGPAASALILMYFVVPTWAFGRQLLKARLNRHGGIEWFATGNAVVALVTYLVIVFILLGYYLAGGESDLLQMVQRNLQESAASLDPAMIEQFSLIAEHYPFLVFGSVLWFTVLVIYGTACLANFICKSYGKALRPSIAITPFDPPVYVPAWLLLSGVTGFFVPHETAYIPQTAFFLFLIPYFLLGLALIHEQSRAWEGRRFWLSGIYLFLLMAQWPALLLAGWGFVHHMRRLTNTPTSTGK